MSAGAARVRRAAPSTRTPGGDFVKTGKAGATVAVGMHFGKPAGIGWGFEVGYRLVEMIIKGARSS